VDLAEHISDHPVSSVLVTGLFSTFVRALGTLFFPLVYAARAETTLAGFTLHRLFQDPQTNLAFEKRLNLNRFTTGCNHPINTNKGLIVMIRLSSASLLKTVILVLLVFFILS
jgi:hypothetical protein